MHIIKRLIQKSYDTDTFVPLLSLDLRSYKIHILSVLYNTRFEFKMEYFFRLTFKYIYIYNI